MYTKGQSGNLNGRKKGIPNKATGLQREWIQKLLDKQGDKIEAELSTLEGKDYLTTIISLLDFTTPRLTRADLTTKFLNNNIKLMNIDPLSLEEFEELENNSITIIK